MAGKNKSYLILGLYCDNEYYVALALPKSPNGQQMYTSLKGRPIMDIISLLQMNNLSVSALVFRGSRPAFVNNFATYIPYGVFSNKVFKKTVYRNWSEFSRFIKCFNPSVAINPIQITPNIVYDSPYIYVNGVLLCEWLPYYEEVKQIKGSSFSIKDNFLSYMHERELYILPLNSLRHVPVKAMDNFIVNLQSGKTTRHLAVVENEKYRDMHLCFDPQKFGWEITKAREVAIFGSKAR